MPIDLEPLLTEKSGTIFVVERDEVIRSALHFILDDQNQTYSFSGVDPACAKGRIVAPDLVLLGIDFFRSDGERVLAIIKRALPGAKILMVANSENDPLARASLACGSSRCAG